MDKKADFVWSHLANIILVLALVVVLLLAIYFLRGNLSNLWDQIVEFLRFGG